MFHEPLELQAPTSNDLANVFNGCNSTLLHQKFAAVGSERRQTKSCHSILRNSASEQIDSPVNHQRLYTYNDVFRLSRER
jgi:hypothetical protein